ALDANIGYVMRNKHAKSGGKVLGGTCQKQSDKQKLLHDYDFIIELAADIWSELNTTQREALLLHEIMHVGVEVDDDGEAKMFIRPHDTEEFAYVIKVYGLYSLDLQAIGAAIEASKRAA
ncbi:MAG: hypothetical protein LLG06_08035, partial [Desulfobacteraceae bacterium]|nr:hypothetical protein [Desulfobacteraceae bacterium]